MPTRVLPPSHPLLSHRTHPDMTCDKFVVCLGPVQPAAAPRLGTYAVRLSTRRKREAAVSLPLVVRPWHAPLRLDALRGPRRADDACKHHGPRQARAVCLHSRHHTRGRAGVSLSPHFLVLTRADTVPRAAHPTRRRRIVLVSRRVSRTYTCTSY
jgi:hypothetical protein